MVTALAAFGLLFGAQSGYAQTTPPPPQFKWIKDGTLQTPGFVKVGNDVVLRLWGELDIPNDDGKEAKAEEGKFQLRQSSGSSSGLPSGGWAPEGPGSNGTPGEYVAAVTVRNNTTMTRKIYTFKADIKDWNKNVPDHRVWLNIGFKTFGPGTELTWIELFGDMQFTVEPIAEEPKFKVKPK
jgi:hypothetical protein